jgi:hypothetical protein
MRRFFKKLFGSANERDNTTKVNIPPDWRHTIADLMNDLKNGKREQIGEPELTWAREYERSLIPVNYRFPKKGDLYQAKFDQVIDYLTAWSAPYTGSGTATIYKGEQIWVDSDPTDEKPVGVYALPVNYKDLEERIIPSSDRAAFNYNGYYFHIDTKAINENFDLIQTNFNKEKYT